MPTDDIPGMHIIHPIQFSSYAWTSEANHGLKKDFEDKVLLFPSFDPTAFEEDRRSGRVDADEISLYDTLEDCNLEIEELKAELATIVCVQVGASGRERWDTPDIKEPGSKKGRLRKDRYSALLMANMVARQQQRLSLAQAAPAQSALGGFAGAIQRSGNSGDGGPLWVGPEWWLKGAAAASAAYGTVARR